MSSFLSLTDGPIAQLIDMGGPVMVVLLALAVFGLVTFVYLMLLGTCYAPRLSGRLKQTVMNWQSNPDSVRPAEVRSQAGRWGRMNPLLHLVTNTIEALQNRQDDRQIREAVLREMDRGGQIFFVHNRIQDIEQVHKHLRALIPEAAFSVA
ncbi:MAG: hypothetical protein VX324_01020, partial [Pseudomonadota bacterium]|nr:hypothetical protein [Pseudomonadota bacterium]